MKSYFASVAPSYDRLQPIVAGRSYSAALDMIVDLVPFEPEDSFRFVELGCGTAEPSARILARFPRATGLCLDSERGMLELAKQKLAECADRAQICAGDLIEAPVPPCNIALSAKAFHHVPPKDIPFLLSRVAKALQPGGCFILYDGMAVGPRWGAKIGEQSRQLYRRHLRQAITEGRTTQAEVDARWAFKKKMKAAGKDVEYTHTAEGILRAMTQVGFSEVGIVWRMFGDTILVGFTPEK